LLITLAPQLDLQLVPTVMYQTIKEKNAGDAFLNIFFSLFYLQFVPTMMYQTIKQKNA
jgi:hypothetical protein